MCKTALRSSCSNKATNRKDADFIRKFEHTIKETIRKHRLLSRKDRIIVAASGGKDSTAILHVLHLLGYNVQAATVDAGIGKYSRENLERLRSFCRKHRTRLYEMSFRKEFRASLQGLCAMLESSGHKYKPCTVCGVLKRSLLSKKAAESGATRLVVGHNLDDEAQSIMMNLMRNRPELNARLGPRNSLPGRQLAIRTKPLYFTREADIEKYSRLMNLPVKYGRCPRSASGFRSATRDFLADCEKHRPGTKKNIVLAFLRQRKKLRQSHSLQKSHGLCTRCSAPASSAACKACTLLSLARTKPHKGI